MKNHINLVGTLHIVFSSLGLLAAFLFSVFFKLIGNFADDMEADFILNIVGNALAVFFVIISVPGIIGGIGLLKRKQWARILIIIVSALDVLNFPFGTALGIYSIWALVQPEVVKEFENSPMQNAQS